MFITSSGHHGGPSGWEKNLRTKTLAGQTYVSSGEIRYLGSLNKSMCHTSLPQKSQVNRYQRLNHDFCCIDSEVLVRLHNVTLEPPDWLVVFLWGPRTKTSCKTTTQTRVNVVDFLLQLTIVSSTNHMTPGHSLLIRVTLDPSVPSLLRRAHIAQRITHKGSLVISDWASRMFPVYTSVDWREYKSPCGITSLHQSPCQCKAVKRLYNYSLCASHWTMETC